mmetsp:Transcript_36461/g.85190  ORF Transcript_36461/g.85190 Transcript_36461/m.85190 type:complete len:256 (+) Transcript_36461:777-1544(+)
MRGSKGVAPLSLAPRKRSRADGRAVTGGMGASAKAAGPRTKKTHAQLSELSAQLSELSARALEPSCTAGEQRRGRQSQGCDRSASAFVSRKSAVSLVGRNRLEACRIWRRCAAQTDKDFTVPPIAEICLALPWPRRRPPRGRLAERRQESANLFEVPLWVVLDDVVVVGASHDVRVNPVLRGTVVEEMQRMRAVDRRITGAVDDEHWAADALYPLDIGERIAEVEDAHWGAAASNRAEASRRWDEHTQARRERRV